MTSGSTAQRPGDRRGDGGALRPSRLTTGRPLIQIKAARGSGLDAGEAVLRPLASDDDDFSMKTKHLGHSFGTVTTEPGFASLKRAQRTHGHADNSHHRILVVAAVDDAEVAEEPLIQPNLDEIVHAQVEHVGDFSQSLRIRDARGLCGSAGRAGSHPLEACSQILLRNLQSVGKLLCEVVGEAGISPLDRADHRGADTSLRAEFGLSQAEKHAPVTRVTILALDVDEVSAAGGPPEQQVDC